ncbi:MAG: hypothetical protein S0880_26490 [Actinomycetota bacterium]|nr:hypothetical protein [Actinomycetota bacterium]
MSAAVTDAASTSSDERRWVLAAHAENRPGALTTIAAAFSSRGVNFDATVATVDRGADGEAGTGNIVVLFSATERRARQLGRTVDRLELVRDVEVRPAEDASVRATGVVRTDGPTVYEPPASAGVTWAGDGGSHRPMLIEGSLRSVERVLTDARACGATALLGVVVFI